MKCTVLTAVMLSGLVEIAIAASPAYPEVDLVRAEEIVSGRCFLCHGMEGESSTSLYPRLAGQHYQYVAKQLADFKAGRRQSDTMQSMAAELSEAEMLALGVFFEMKPAVASPVGDADLAAVGKFVFFRGNEYSGVAACATCHGQKAYGTAQLPRLAGQGARYLENQLKSFNRRERTNDNAVMHSIASRLTELEVKAVAAFISSMR
ncbi:MAG: c-type cytochrome [Zoogloeaceae bacterium]|nr:c-type cytochrome [Rhodocyclaceae bacterium]MCP5238556.1 c-type cytochrome [Zoogloeaceae bacterium]MCP5254530.1 c-type cytochrome [Zoogloeaceae bacterium]MCP5295223.1 c-type cytochrome [Zoogloeaceae bacterium]MCW5613834.1 c-type cytochrome [Rhodocyclaceae bacterium]